ncbi:beta-N-acetylhexosaminidase [Lysinibacillus telephonicus]|uniref:Beta-N-acetylhexosaminidase n=1 Tax=Lysinibacillus telephonicus TaxID=1714840 RepID=A0A431UV70_9BACI|nr:beta-N-acetylhexosaminidase [Lysinibacillus telephonicus]RTQ94620.1 beta-N-acetylhexosaminidase [Lysinibacillus telephonicus]
MNKKMFFVLLTIVIILGCSMFLYKNAEKSDSQIANESETKVEDYSPVLLEDIFTQSKQGKILNAPFIAGKTNLEEVIELWGNPNVIDNTSVGDYSDYISYEATIGSVNSVVVDVRSYKSDLNTIRLKDIEAFAGKPDKITYYQDKNNDQIILIYNVSSTYQLKWILPRPTESEPNPKVHHISVLSQNNLMIQQIQNKISKMTLEEKIGQMIFTGISGKTLNENDLSLINEYKVGGIIFFKGNLVSTNQTLNLLNEIKSVNEKNDFPLFLGIDEEGGRISRLPKELIGIPSSKKISESNDVFFAHDIGKILGKELSAFGFNLNFAPVLDVNSNPKNPVIGDRSFGDNPDIVSSFGIEVMKGLQSQNIISVVKHFPGHGDTAVDSHLDLPVVNKSLDQLKKLELIPFKKAFAEGTDVVMVAHILLPKIDSTFPSSMSKEIITGILREQLNFDGVVITDDLTMKAITNNYDITAAAVNSVKAGSDIILIAHDYHNVISSFQALKKAVESGEISEERIDESVTRILQLKEKYKIDNSKVNKINIEELNRTINKVLNKYNS